VSFRYIYTVQLLLYFTNLNEFLSVQICKCLWTVIDFAGRNFYVTNCTSLIFVFVLFGTIFIRTVFVLLNLYLCNYI